MVLMKKHAELFAKGKPIHPYSLQCKVLNILKYSSTPLHFVYPASRLEETRVNCLISRKRGQ